MQLHQYFGACITDIRLGVDKMTQSEFAYLLLCLSSVQSPTFLLPQDLYFMVDKANGVLTGSSHVFTPLDVQALFCVLNGAGIDIDNVRCEELIKEHDADRKNAVRSVSHTAAVDAMSS